MDKPRRTMVISKAWFQASILTFLFGFAVLGYLAYRISWDHPPIRKEVRAADGAVLFTGDDVMAGQHLFQKYGLMQLGTIFGHGAYLGPGFAAQYPHSAVLGHRPLTPVAFRLVVVTLGRRGRP